MGLRDRGVSRAITYLSSRCVDGGRLTGTCREPGLRPCGGTCGQGKGKVCGLESV